MTDNVPIKEDKVVPIFLHEETEEPKHAVQKGIYDIHYAIALLRSIEEMVNKKIMNCHDLQFTLKTSLRKMICYLEVERDQM